MLAEDADPLTAAFNKTAPDVCKFGDPDSLPDLDPPLTRTFLVFSWASQATETTISISFFCRFTLPFAADYALNREKAASHSREFGSQYIGRYSSKDFFLTYNSIYICIATWTMVKQWYNHGIMLSLHFCRLIVSPSQLVKLTYLIIWRWDCAQKKCYNDPHELWSMNCDPFFALNTWNTRI